MKFFVAQLLYRVEDAAYAADRYEIQCRLVLAPDPRQAVSEAQEMGQADEATLTDFTGRLIRRAFVGIKDLREVALEQGARLFSELQELEPLAFPNRVEPAPQKKIYVS